MWKDFFYFSKTERLGILLLITIILVFIASPLVFNKQEVLPAIDDKSKEECEQFFSTMQNVEKKKHFFHTYNHNPQVIALRSFDPNTADSMELQQLGLSRWIVRNIIHYRQKGGRFKKPEDFKKIYGITQEQYNTLLPYLSITSPQKNIDTLLLLTTHTIKKDSVYKYPIGTTIELNKADTTELKKIPGVGSYIANLIVNYRKSLGFYYTVDQLKDIHLKVDKLRPWLTISKKELPYLNLNKVGLAQLMRHPYLNFYQAKVIVEHRKKKGKLQSLNQLILYEEFTSFDFERLKPYICFN
ncbi:MAG: ComEA family DNA-binding protein [Bacteroides sp.]